MARKLVHYLRNERRRQGLTQTDVAALLGGRWKGRVSWYERGGMPPTPVALEYEAIFGKHVSALLGGAYGDAARRVKRRAELLLRHQPPPNTLRRLRRHDTLTRIAG